MANPNNLFYTLKALGAFLVICLHCSFPVLGRFINPFARVAVPVFFLISGYYVVTRGNDNKSFINKNLINARLASIISIVIIPILIYSIFNVVSGRPLEIDKRFLLFNFFPIAHHLWYCFAYIYVLILSMVLFRHIHSIKVLFAIVTTLLLGNILLGAHSWIWNFHEWSGVYTRNFLFTGIPCFLLGVIIAKIEHNISWRRSKVLLWIAVFAALTYVEALVLKLTGLRPESGGDVYVTTIPLATLIFIACLKSDYKIKTNMFVRIGDQYSSYIYLYHVLTIWVLEYFLQLYELDGIWMSIFINPVMVFVITLLFSIIIDRFNICLTRVVKYKKI